MKKLHEELEKVLKSNVLVKVLCVVGIIIVVMLIFSAGISVGFHKASFGKNWGENYGRNFGMRSEFPGPGFGRDNFPNAHGTVGKILKVELPNIIVQDKDGIEKVIVVKDDTFIQKMRENMTMNSLKIDDVVTVIGSPNAQGQIEAKLIRIMLAPDFLKNNLPINSPQTNNEKLSQ